MEYIRKMDRLSLQTPRGVFTSLVFTLFLQSCRGQPQLLGPSKPIVASIGDDITLPCYLKPATMDVTAKTLEWTRVDLDPAFVFVWRAGREFEKTKHPSYRGRTSLFTDELKHGNMSLKLSNVNLSDKGTYRCYIVEMDEEFFTELVVGSDVASPAVLTLERIDVENKEVILNCESAGWYPEPELLWLDAEGNLLPAAPAETLRGPDGLYAVSSRVTVEKKHSNKFTCRVQQKNINQSRETHIRVPDDFFMFSCSFTVPTIIGSVFCLAVIIMVYLIAVIFTWKINKTIKRDRCDEPETQEMMNLYKNDKTETDQEQEKLMTQYIMLSLRDSSSEEQKRKEAENEAETMMKKVDHFFTDGEKVKDEKQELQHLLDAKEKELKPLLSHWEMVMEQSSAFTGQELQEKQEVDKKEEDSEELKFPQERNSSYVEEQVKQPEKSQRNFQEQNQSSSANHSSVRGDIILEEVDRHGHYLCLKNTSSEDKLMEGWELKLQINQTEPLTYKFKLNYTLKAGQELTLRQMGTRNPNPNNDDLMWTDMTAWSPEDELTIDLISNTGEKHRLK